MTPIPCGYWSDCGVRTGGCCALGKFGGKPGRGACLTACPHGKPSKGLGDTVEKALDRVGLAGPIKRAIRRVTRKPCGCGKRKAAWNEVVPYKLPPAAVLGPCPDGVLDDEEQGDQGQGDEQDDKNRVL